MVNVNTHVSNGCMFKTDTTTHSVSPVKNKRTAWFEQMIAGVPNRMVVWIMFSTIPRNGDFNLAESVWQRKLNYNLSLNYNVKVKITFSKN